MSGGSVEGGMMTGFEWSESGRSSACCYLEMTPSPFCCDESVGGSLRT